jgi:hypothetical protein
MRAMYILIAAAFAIGLFMTAAPAQMVNAADDEVDAEWTMVDTPTFDGFVLSPESVIYDYALASEGDVAYAIVQAWDENDDTYAYRLLKSDNAAATWDDITDTLETQVEDDGYGQIDELLQVATDWVDPDFVAIAVVVNTGYSYTPVVVYISNDGGDTFVDTGEVEDGTVYIIGGARYGVADLAISYEVDGKRDIAIGGTNSNGVAGIFRSTVTGDTASAWDDATTFDGWDDGLDSAPSWWLTDIIFSPNWAIDRTILVTTIADGTSTDFAVYLQCGSWGTTTPGWNDASTLGIYAVPIVDNVPMPLFLFDMDGRGLAGITLPSDYNSKNSDTRLLWVWANYWDPTASYAATSMIMRVDNDESNPVIQQVKSGTLWLTNVSYYGTIAEGKAIAGILGTGGIEFMMGSPDDLWTGCCEGVQVYSNDSIANMDICCEHWQKACKPPTGMAAMAVSYVTQDKAYAVALDGYVDIDEGAWSVSFDDGNTWNQLSLIDTYIHYFSDVAVSPDCNKMWVVGINTNEGRCDCDSVFLKAEDLPEASEYSGYWIRVWCGSLTGTWFETSYEGGFLRLPADETAGDTVFLVDYKTNNVYWNDLEGLGCWTPIASTTLDEIVDLAAPTADMLYALDFSGDVSMYDDEGWHDAVSTDVNHGWSIAVHGDYILVGSAWDGEVAISDDGGETFELADEAVPLLGDNGHTTVAFDTYFDTNNVIYAAVEGWYYDGWSYSSGGIYDWVLGTSEDWTDLGANNNYAYTGIVLSYLGGNPFTSADTGGVLYASYVYWDDYWTEYGTGVARSLTPIVEEEACAACPSEWDYLDESMPENYFYGSDSIGFEATPFALKACGCLTADTNTKLYAIDSWYDYNMIDGTYADGYGGAVWTFEDCYAKKAVEVSSPADGFVVATSTCDCCNVPFNIFWDRLCDACCYDIEFALDADFTQIVPIYFDGMIDGPLTELDGEGYFYCPESGTNPSAFIPCNFQPETTYYWRVRAAEAGTGQYIHSWWSDARSFTVAPTAAAGAINLVAPIAGATDVGIKNVGFSWDMLAEWDSFDFVLSPNADLSAPLSTKTGLHGTATTYTAGTLTYATTYYWQVTAYKDGSAISTSPIGTFTTTPHGAFCSAIDGACFDTEAALEAHNSDLASQTAPTPFWVWVVIGIGAVLVIVVIVLIFRTRRV